jgi:hypothetical protein
MNELMGMGLVGWLVSLVAGFVIGGVFFLSIRLQVDYVLKKSGPLWVVPAALYARIGIVAAMLVLVAVKLPGEKIAGAMLAGMIGAFVARVLVSRMVKKSSIEEPERDD